MHLTGEITLGNLAIVVTLLGIAIRFGSKLGSFETTLKAHSLTLVQHAEKLEKHEDRFMGFVAQLQMLVGRVELLTERRSHEDRRAI